MFLPLLLPLRAKIKGIGAFLNIILQGKIYLSRKGIHWIDQESSSSCQFRDTDKPEGVYLCPG